MPNIPHNYSITFRAASLLGSQCCVLRYAAAPLTPPYVVKATEKLREGGVSLHDEVSWLPSHPNQADS